MIQAYKNVSCLATPSYIPYKPTISAEEEQAFRLRLEDKHSNICAVLDLTVSGSSKWLLWSLVPADGGDLAGSLIDGVSVSVSKADPPQEQSSFDKLLRFTKGSSFNKVQVLC